jgi:hypothetical protein
MRIVLVADDEESHDVAEAPSPSLRVRMMIASERVVKRQHSPQIAN